MFSFASIALYFAAALSFAAALLHFICVYWGAEGFRFLGAGEKIVKQAENGQWYPNAMAIIVGLILSIFAIYALSVAQENIFLPLSKWVLSFISLVLLARGFGFPLIKSRFKGNSDLFWYVSSSICIVLGSLYAFGTYLVFYSK